MEADVTLQEGREQRKVDVVSKWSDAPGFSHRTELMVDRELAQRRGIKTEGEARKKDH
jgi:hypothetical protein